MSESKYIHETIIKDIVDMAFQFPKEGEDYLPGILKANGSKSYRSIAAGSDKLTLVFPVFTSNSIGIESAMIISKAIERKCVTMLQMLFSAVNITDAKDAFEYVSKFHGNIEGDITVDNFINTLDTYVSKEENALPFSNKDAYELLKEDMKNINYTLPDTIKEASLNDIVVTHTNGKSNYVLTEALKNEKDLADYMKNASEAKKNQIIDTGYKKANELVPTMMVVQFVSPDKGIVTTSVVGVKAKMYPIDSNDVINRLMLKNKDNNGLNKFIRATTREISFWKDFVFAVDKAKIDAISSGRRGSSSKIWKVLERRAKIGNLKRFFGLNNDAAAISTLVVSQDDVESLEKQYDIDVSRPNVIRPIMESYSLMGFVIVDETAEVAKFIFDTGDDNYESVTFRNLEKESDGDSAKKIINLMTKVAQ